MVPTGGPEVSQETATFSGGDVQDLKVRIEKWRLYPGPLL
jgi:hypothetical protein